jgi:CBS domain-containing protein
MGLESELKVKDIMMKGPVTLEANDVLDLADDVMNLGRIRHIPIVEGEQVVGVLSQRDLFYSALVKALGVRHREQKDLMKTLRVREVMIEPVVTISPNHTVKEAARLMAEKKIGCLPVTQGETLVGLVTETDILRYVASH